MPTTKKLHTTGSKGYETFLRGLDLKGLGLKSCTTSVDRPAFFESLRKDSKAVKKIEEGYRLTSVKEKYFNAEANFSLTVSEPPNTAPAFIIECVFQVHIHATAPVDKDFAKRFTESELRLVVRPYVRQFITSTMGQMSLPPLLIPLGPAG